MRDEQYSSGNSITFGRDGLTVNVKVKVWFFWGPGSSVVLFNFILDVRLSGVRAYISIVNIRKFYEMQQNIVRF